jgi:hypothetical protein
MILVEQAQVVVNLGARIVLFKQYSILGQSALELTDALVVESQSEVIDWCRQPPQCRSRSPRDRQWMSNVGSNGKRA